MTSIQVYEGQTNWPAGFDLRDLPAGIPAGIRPVTQAGRSGLDVQGVVGTLPLASGKTLQILPKVGQANFLYMLFRSMGSAKELERQFNEFAAYSASRDGNVGALAARALSTAAVEVLARGPITQRKRTIKYGNSSVGRLDSERTVLRLKRHTSDPVVSTLRVRSHSTPENRIIGEALSVAVSLLSGSNRSDAIRTLHLWKRRIHRGSPENDDLQIVEDRLAGGWYGGARGYYARAIVLALVLVGARGLDNSIDPTVEGEALLMNSADVFERYIRRVIGDSHSAAGFVVTKSGLTQRNLYRDGSFRLEPDVVIEDSGGVRLVVDAKYKQPDPGDHYQILSYLAANEVDVGVLVTPEARDGKVTLDKYHTAWGATTVVANLPMDEHEEAEDYLGEILTRSI